MLVVQQKLFASDPDRCLCSTIKLDFPSESINFQICPLPASGVQEANMADRSGQHFGNYRLVSLLGQGGYAEVYLGQHVRLNQQAAIKVLHAHLTSQEAEHFQQEAQTISQLSHPSIIRVFDFDVQDGVPFLVIDYAPNGSLRQRYPKGQPGALPQVISLVKQVADALQYAHEQKFIHRDVKPENMLLGRRQEVLLSDFGIATIAHSTSSLKYRRGHVWHAGLYGSRADRGTPAPGQRPVCAGVRGVRMAVWRASL